MPLLTSSLSRYTVSGSYVVDFFTTKKDGKTTVSFIPASHYNTLASSIIATQTRLLAIASTSTNVDTLVYLNFYSATKVNLTKRDGGGAIRPFQSKTNTTGQNGISDGVINSTQISSGLTSDFFWGQSLYDSSAGEWIRIGFRDNVAKPGRSGSPTLVANLVTDTVSTLDPNTYQDITQILQYKRPTLSSLSLGHTPYHSMLLIKAKNVDNSSGINPAIDRQMIWNSTNAMKDTDYSSVRTRVLIGSSRGVSLGRQSNSNKSVYNPPLAGTGSVTSVPTGFSQDGTNLLGPGALMLSGSFYIPVQSEVEVPTSYSSYGGNSSWATNRFFCYPGFNSPRNHVTLAPGYNGLIAHVLVFGLK